MRVASAVLIWICSITYPFADQPDQETQREVAKIIDAWKASAERMNSVELQWKRVFVNDLDRFSRYQAFWADPDSNPTEQHGLSAISKLQTNANSFRIESARCTYGSHKRDRVENAFEPAESTQYTPLTPVMQQARIPTDLLTALDARLQQPTLEIGQSYPFTRTIDGTRWIDKLHHTSGGCSRVTVRKPASRGSVAWARLTPEEAVNDQVSSLDHQAALLALRRTESPTIMIDADDLRILAETQVIGGWPCWVLEERVADTPHFRSYWVDPEHDFVIRRFLGRVELPDTQIDASYLEILATRYGDTMIEIEYEANEQFGWVPRAWHVICQETPQHPVQDFCRSRVQNIESFEANLDKHIAADFHVDSPNSWVVDEISEKQYIVMASGDTRELLESELAWQPTFADLVNSKPGQLAAYISVDRSERRLRQVVAAGGVFLLCIATLVKIRRRGRAGWLVGRLRRRGNDDSHNIFQNARVFSISTWIHLD